MRLGRVHINWVKVALISVARADDYRSSSYQVRWVQVAFRWSQMSTGRVQVKSGECSDRICTYVQIVQGEYKSYQFRWDSVAFISTQWNSPPADDYSSCSYQVTWVQVAFRSSQMSIGRVQVKSDECRSRSDRIRSHSYELSESRAHFCRTCRRL